MIQKERLKIKNNISTLFDIIESIKKKVIYIWQMLISCRDITAAASLGAGTSVIYTRSGGHVPTAGATAIPG